MTKLNKEIKLNLFLGSIFLGMAVAIGAFGAHGLKQVLIGKYSSTFQTGVEYQYYHGFALLILGLLKSQFTNLKIRFSSYAFAIGILLFSYNCYFYATTHIKFFALIVPLGGVLFLAGWMVLAYQVHKDLN